ncbi:MAG: InlB B-repeat-containing protein [Lachnospiraceae bacterium]|nr:InlB B-repeat-containing protein [Lachnospiraceae bacterium]
MRLVPVLLFGLFFMVCCASVTASASSLSAYTKYAGISLSPDGLAFTTDAGVKTYERYPAGYTVYTGEKTADAPATGEHYYTETNVSEVRILKWEVYWANSKCIHSYFNIGYYHGISYANTICRKDYAQGWVAYCADCGEQLNSISIYMNSSTARGIRTLPGSAEYYYLCPWCGGLEQGAGYSHTCKRVSANGYTVRYDANTPAGAVVSGSMDETGHMYGNAALYEGVSAAEAGYGSACLRLNTYVCEGYVFTGWNTKADGSGTFYADGAAVLNLTAVNEGIVTLYAQWEKEKSDIPENKTAPDYPDTDGGTIPEVPDQGDETEPEDVMTPDDPDPESGTAPDPDGGTDSDEQGNPGQGEEAESDPLEEPEQADELVLTAWIGHSRSGYSGDFKSGEGGVLYICAQGYADRIEVVFPDEFTAVFPEVNRTFQYEKPAQTQEENCSFSVPLYTAPGVYQITVRAYREDEEAAVCPVLAVSKESVLDELRTRIRNNQ